MNITDVQTAAPQIFGERGADETRIRDMLETMLQRQDDLEEQYEEIERGNGLYVPSNRSLGQPLDLNDPRNQLFLKDAAYRAVEELSEATNCLKNKPWKNSRVQTDEVHFLEEMADATHFFLRMWLYISGTPQAAAEMMYKLYFKKSEVNRFRQESNY